MTVVFVNSVVVGEGDGFAEFVVGLDAPASKPVSLTFVATAQGLGLLRLMSHGIADEADTEGAAASLVFSPGETRKTVRVPIVDDDLAEGAEQFMLTLTLMPQSVIDGVQLRVRSGYALIHDNDGPAANATVAVDDVIVDEKDGVARFVIRLGDLTNGGAALGEVRVGYRTVDGSAIAGQDYTATSGTLEFAPGRNIAVVEVPIADDALSEGVERFTLELTEASGGASLLDAVAVGEIGLSDGTVVSQPLLSIDPLVVSEGERFADLTLRLSAPAFDPIGVTFGILASQPTLEFLPPGDLAFAPGQTTLTVRLPLTQDGRDLVPTLPGKVGDWQGPLLAARSVTAPQQYVPGSSLLMLSPAIVVLSNDTLVTTPTVFVDDIVVDEKRGQAVFVLRLGRHDGEASAQPVWVDFTTRDGSAVAGADYVAASGRAVFEPGESVARVAIDLIDDALAEASETFELVLGSAHGAVLGDSAAAAEIALSDGTPLSRPLISAADLVVDESVGMGMLVVRLSAPSPNVVTLNYKIESPEREGGEAFMAMAGVLGSSLVFAPGETVHSVPFVIVDDDAIEAVEQFDVVLSGAGNGTLVRQVVHVQVRDNDRVEALPALRVEAPTVDEGAAAAQFVVSLGARGGESADHPVTVHWHTVDGSASAGQDYVGASGTLRFEPGESVKTVPMALIDDPSAESAERFSLVLEAPEGALLLTPSATATIAASDAGILTQPRLSIEGAVASERDQFVDCWSSSMRPRTFRRTSRCRWRAEQPTSRTIAIFAPPSTPSRQARRCARCASRWSTTASPSVRSISSSTPSRWRAARKAATRRRW